MLFWGIRATAISDEHVDVTPGTRPVHSRTFFPRPPDSAPPTRPPAGFGPANSPSALTAMLARRALQGLARPLTRLSSTSTPVPTHEAPTPATAAPQSPNFASTWSTSQRARPQAHSGPRFEQTVMELQPNPLSAMEMINKEPIRVVHGRKAVCDGGMSASIMCTCYLSLFSIFHRRRPARPPQDFHQLGRLLHPRHILLVVNCDTYQDKPGPRPCGYVSSIIPHLQLQPELFIRPAPFRLTAIGEPPFPPSFTAGLPLRVSPARQRSSFRAGTSSLDVPRHVYTRVRGGPIHPPRPHPRSFARLSAFPLACLVCPGSHTP